MEEVTVTINHRFFHIVSSVSPCLPDSHPSDLKHRFYRHHSSASLHGSFNHNHVHDTNLPLVVEEPDESKGAAYDPKQDVFVTLFVSCFMLDILQLCVSNIRPRPKCGSQGKTKTYIYVPFFHVIYFSENNYLTGV